MLALVTFVTAIVGGGYIFVGRYVAVKEALTAQVAGQQKVLEAQVAAIRNRDDALDRFVQAQNETNAALHALQKNQERSNAEVTRIRDVLSKHDMEKLSLAKPLLVERRINAGSARIARLLRAATGGTNDERGEASGTTRSSSAAPDATTSAVPRASVPRADTGDDEDAD